MSTLRLSEIWIYPIKSLGGIQLQHSLVLPKGLWYDRRWMLVDDHGVAMTQRVYPEMALFKPAINGDQLNITYKKDKKEFGSTGFAILHQLAKPKITAQVWNDQVEVQEVDPAVSQWFSDKLHIPCKLVSFPENNPRRVNSEYAIGDDHVSLADAYPFMMIGQASLDDLNARLRDPVPMNRFRPTFVFTGGTAFLEDSWRDLSIGTVQFTAVKKCDRCVLTTVNQDTAEKGSEPLRTLSSYRKVDNNVYFGQNMIARDQGTVTIGDTINPS